MGTRSIIAAEFDKEHDGGIVATYCHYDGYISGVGKTLIESYNDDESAFELADMGYLSVLDSTMDGTIAYDHANSDSVDYFDNADCLAGANWGQEYIYLWRDGQWWVLGDQSDSVKWLPLDYVLSQSRLWSRSDRHCRRPLRSRSVSRSS